jgi:hypothetical protein
MRRAQQWMILVAGCGPAVPTDETGGSDATADGDGGKADSTGPDATATATMTGIDTMTDPTLGTTVGTTATTVEPVGCDTEFVTACQAYCATVITCNPEEGIYEECVTGCSAELAAAPPECALAQCAAFACYGTLTCEQLDAGTLECDALADEIDQACGTDGGGCFIGFGPDETCEYGCDGSPSRRVSCAGAACTCYEDEVQVGACESPGICTAPDTFEANAQACCGW